MKNKDGENGGEVGKTGELIRSLRRSESLSLRFPLLSSMRRRELQTSSTVVKSQFYKETDINGLYERVGN